MVRCRDISPVDVTEAALDRIDEINPRLNAFLTVSRDSALQTARILESAARAGQIVGPLHGVPIGIKDNIDTHDAATTGGSDLLRGRRPESDAIVVQRLRSAGAVILGKLNMHEFAYGVTSANPHYGHVHNPWNLEHTPGGSSGGSGAAIAARLCHAALGTDTGCSIRLPAGFNGVCGLRPTIGRISNVGIIPLAWTLDTVGPLCRTVDDCALVCAVIAGSEVGDRHTARVAVQDYDSQRDEHLEGVRVGLVEDFSLAELDVDVDRALRDAVKVLETAGAAIRKVNLNCLEHATSAVLTIDVAEPAAYHGRNLRSRKDRYGDDVRLLLETGELLLATHYIQAQRYRTLIQNEIELAFEKCDVILLPVAPCTAPRHDVTEIELSSGQRIGMIPAALKYNALASLSGMPALALPCGFSESSMPIGMQVMAPAFREDRLFRVGRAFQEVTDWHTRAPSTTLAHTPTRDPQ